MASTLDICKKNHLLFVFFTLQTLYEYTACLDILGNGISSHFGVYSAHLLCNGSNSCCLCLAFTVRFIHKHQLPMVLEDSTAENPLYLFVVIILYYRHSISILYAWIFWEVASSVCWKIHCGVYSAHLLHMQWQQHLLPVSCFHFSVSLLHAWLFWKMTSLLCWKFTLVYRVQIHYAMATILVACVLQSLQNTTIEHKYQWFSENYTSQNICDWQLSKRTAHRIYIELMRAILSKVTTLYCEYRITIQSPNTGLQYRKHIPPT